MVPESKRAMQSAGTRGVKKRVLACALLVAAVLLVYGRTLGHEFVSYDDATYVVQNPFIQNGLTAEGVRWAFETHGYAANWHPLTWLSHMLDVQLFGLDPAGHHAMNVALHALASCLCLLALTAAGIAIGPSFFVAALFAVHPLRVESVAWVAERKDLLSGVFFFATLWAYARWARAPRWTGRLWVALYLALGLLAKPMLVTLPFVLVLWDVWPLRRVPKEVRLGQALAEKLPLFLLAAVSAFLTWQSQSAAGAVHSFESVGLIDRVANAMDSYAAYARHAIQPADLACIRPHQALVDPDGTAMRLLHGAGAGLVLLAITALVFRARSGRPWFLTGWLLYLGMLVPVIGLVQVGSHAWADRYAYLPLVGLQIAIACEAADVIKRSGGKARRPFQAAAGFVLLVFGGLAWRQAGVWRDTETLFRHAISVVEDNYVAHINLGNELAAREGTLAWTEAKRHFEIALVLRPNNIEAHNNLGGVLIKEGHAAEARPHFEEALRVSPRYVEAHFNLAWASRELGDKTTARRHFEAALRLRPTLAAARQALDELNEPAETGEGAPDPGVRRP